MDRTITSVNLYNKIAASYSQKIKSSIPLQSIKLFTNALSVDAKVLDAGCAAGRDSRIIKDLGFNVIGVDLSEELLKIGKQENPDINFIKGDLRRLPFEDGFFDGIYACAVLLELDKVDIPIVLKEFSRVLKSEGVLYIRTKEGEGIKTIEKDILADTERLVTFLNITELHTMLSDAMFTKVKLFIDESVSRKGLMFLNALYKKVQ